jgi:E3 ubiquitin-protein ligase listerin
LALLNIIVDDGNGIASLVAKQRIVFLVRHLTSSLRNGIASLPIRAEILKCLTVFLPVIKDIYGSYWADISEFLVGTWLSTPSIFKKTSEPSQ